MNMCFCKSGLILCINNWVLSGWRNQILVSVLIVWVSTSSKLPCFLISYKIFGKFLCRTNFRNQLAWRRCLSHQQYTQMPLQGVQMCINAESSGIKQGQAYFVCALWYLSGTRVKGFCEPWSILSYKMQICVSWNNSIQFRNLQAKVKLMLVFKTHLSG